MQHFKNSQHQFSEVPQVEIPRSTFARTHNYKTTIDSGKLIPVYVDEVLPGDTYDISTSHFTRMATPIVPSMDNLYQDFFYFAVPYRLVWENWEKFNGQQTNPGDSTSFLTPVLNSGAGFAELSIEDYFGLPTKIANINVTAFFHRAYNLIWNEWFRDENLQNSVTVDTGNGPDVTVYTLLPRGKRHDYFTSCLPWPQKGPGVEIPLGSTAPIIGTGTVSFKVNSTGGTARGLCSIAAVNGPYVAGANPGALETMYWGATGTNLVADLSSATAATINSLRQAFQVQRLYERDSRGGTRYAEILKAHFGVTSPDARLQRPEYLGGFSSQINVNPVVQTSSSDATTPQGNLSAFVTSSNVGRRVTSSFTEHCLILCLTSIRSELSYQQGLNRMFSRRTRFDYYWPVLAHLGEQEVRNKEIYCAGGAGDEGIFGYQERYAEYRYYPSQITGRFRSNAVATLDVWHYAQKFVALPTLNSTFIQDTPPVKRNIAVQTEPEFLLDVYFDIKATRCMPMYSVPGLIDHF